MNMQTMEEPIINEETISFTPEELEKISLLRKKREEENKVSKITYRTNFDPELKKGDPVKIIANKLCLIGVIVDIKNEKSSHSELEYSISTPYGVIHGLKKDEIRLRYSTKNMLKNVEIPDELMELSAKHLLSLLRGSYGSYDYERSRYSKYTTDQIRAALSKKPHIPNKGEKQKVRKLMSR